MPWNYNKIVESKLYEAYRILQKNIKINKLENKVQSYCVGLSDKSRTACAEFYHYDNIGGTPLSKRPGSIELRTLDSFDFVNNGVFMMKIDVEGMELSVLKGVENTIKRFHPFIMIESFAKAFDSVKEFLEKEGYMYEPLSDHDYLFFHSAINL